MSDYHGSGRNSLPSREVCAENARQRRAARAEAEGPKLSARQREREEARERDMNGGHRRPTSSEIAAEEAFHIEAYGRDLTGRRVPSEVWR